ncbi:hypothetical protein EJ05DRAFT_130934 [Pseudovirgaria hyperparasitica]|uniref:protein-ribulosamine 3-kinase n=1 Tax=Pseudovirgaria hyperparasitica TaxID=470096 RepID=A0A6A6VY23_9PEZI|nr:uncharacterized protein EJ05DRAFT_130934 [Pseudovirgaria hyperparasitica]KAF2754716.1 hypothetical protein EJ05DRAFT_130934 [Pseudovirgaria hyperparasitica]
MMRGLDAADVVVPVTFEDIFTPATKTAMSTTTTTHEDDGVEGAQQQLDPEIQKALPLECNITNTQHLRSSPTATCYRIDVSTPDAEHHSYFLKLARGNTGWEALRGEHESTRLIYSLQRDLTPTPMTWGTLMSDRNTHFYLCTYHDFQPGLAPDPETFSRQLAELHVKSASLGERRFGFHVPTYNGDIRQRNSWERRWETFFAKGLQSAFDLHNERAGYVEELEAVEHDLFKIVVPRLLRPLESDGRRIMPGLIHGDLWHENTAVERGSGRTMIFDAASFWGHNEYELGYWLPEHNKFGVDYFEAYHELVPRSEPVEDYDDRIRLYALRFNLHAAALFPGDLKYRDMVIEEAQLLVEKYTP